MSSSNSSREDYVDALTKGSSELTLLVWGHCSYLNFDRINKFSQVMHDNRTRSFSCFSYLFLSSVPVAILLFILKLHFKGGCFYSFCALLSVDPFFPLKYSSQTVAMDLLQITCRWNTLADPLYKLQSIYGVRQIVSDFCSTSISDVSHVQIKPI